jgi:predicted esterase
MPEPTIHTNEGPHQGQPLYTAGVALEQADAAMILAHGRGAGATDILGVARLLDHPQYAYLAPQAANNTWYPHSFLTSIEGNEPGLSSGLQALDGLVAQVEAAGIPAQRIVLGGFSQGACLASEYVARHARRYGGLLVFSGGVIGPPGTPRDYAGSLEGTPVLIGCSDVDPHIPLERVQETADVFTKLGGDVSLQVYPGMGHTINQDEIDRALAIVQGVVASSPL